jgi:hypothetical protein
LLVAPLALDLEQVLAVELAQTHMIDTQRKPPTRRQLCFPFSESYHHTILCTLLLVSPLALDLE